MATKRKKYNREDLIGLSAEEVFALLNTGAEYRVPTEAGDEEGE